MIIKSIKAIIVLFIAYFIFVWITKNDSLDQLFVERLEPAVVYRTTKSVNKSTNKIITDSTTVRFKNIKQKMNIPDSFKHNQVCKSSLSSLKNSGDSKNPIYFVTPTYPRPAQVADLTRLAQTLMHVKNLLWIIAEDSYHCSQLIQDIVKKKKLSYVHLATPMALIYQRTTPSPKGANM